MRVPWLDEHPGAVIELLDLLKDDPAPLVRRSVANNLNDLGRVHPARLVETCGAWLVEASPARRALIEHALRGALKRGVPSALALLGFGGAPAVELEDVRVSPRRVAIGGRVTVAFALRSTARSLQSLRIDVRVFFVKARGVSPKVFAVDRVGLEPGARTEHAKSISLAVHTTRTPRPGRHVVEALVNGAPLPLGHFDVR